MGSSASKPAKAAASAVSRRQYPKQPSAPPKPAPTPSAAPRSAPKARETKPSPQGPTYHSKEKASTTKSSAIDLDGRDPDFAASLRTIGPVNPHPTLSNSSVFNQRSAAGQTVFPPAATNPALLVITARQRIAKAAEHEAEEIGRPGFAGREYLDAMTIRQALSMRDRQGMSEKEIEGMLRLKKGVLERLGKRGIVGEVG